MRDLSGCLAEICRQVVSRRSPSAPGPDIVTSALVPALLGDGSVDLLPLAVRAAIETERVRLSADTSSDASRPSPLDRVAGESAVGRPRPSVLRSGPRAHDALPPMWYAAWGTPLVMLRNTMRKQTLIELFAFPLPE